MKNSMVKKSRIEIVVALSVSYLLLIVSTIVFYYLSEKSENRNDYNVLMSNHFRVLAEEIGNEGNVENYKEKDNFEGNLAVEVVDDYYSMDRQKALINVAISGQDIDGEFEVYERAGNGTLTDEEIVSVAKDIFSLSKINGRYKNYIFASTLIDDYLCIEFIDITDSIVKETRNLISVSACGLVVFSILVCLSIPISKILVKPLEQSIKRQNEFIRMAEHELKTPLAVMQTSFSMMEKDGIKSKYLSYAMEENQKMKKLVADMLELTKDDSCIGFYANNTVFTEENLSSCIESAVLPFESFAYENKVILNQEIEPGIIKKINGEQIDRLVGILVDNAIKHTAENGKVLVKLYTKESPIGKKAVLSVCNEGEPIPEDEREKIFEPFYRLDKSGNRSQGRFGLGLSIARKIVELHNGNITVERCEGMTIFKVTL